MIYRLLGSFLHSVVPLAMIVAYQGTMIVLSAFLRTSHLTMMSYGRKLLLDHFPLSEPLKDRLLADKP